MSYRSMRAATAFPPREKGVCRVCGSAVRKPRRNYCGDRCAETIGFMVSADRQRQYVLRRDHGRCALCGVDTLFVRRVLNHAREFAWRWGVKLAYRAMVRDSGVPTDWEMDHTVPVCEGGGVRPGMTIDEAMANLRTLCRPCHVEVTRELSRRRAKAAAEKRKSA